MKTITSSNSLKVKKNNLLFFLLILFALYISVCVSNKPDNLDQDYYVYYNGFYESQGKEITFTLISRLCHYLGFGFPFLLFFYCFTSLIIKFRLFSLINFKISALSFLFIFFIYLFCFFPLWEVTQIRISVSIGFFLYGVFCIYDVKLKFLVLILSILFHNSMFVLVGFYSIIYFMYNYKILAAICSLMLTIIAYKILSLTNYEVYSIENWGEDYKILSLKNLYVVVTNFLIFFYLRRNVAEYKDTYNLLFINVYMLVFCFLISFQYPSIATRYSDVILFFSIFALATISKVFYLQLYKVLSMVLLLAYFSSVYFFGVNSMFSLNSFLDLFY